MCRVNQYFLLSSQELLPFLIRSSILHGLREVPMRPVSAIVKVISVAALVGLCSGCGPHMIEQQKITPYERRMPTMPAGTVPIQGRLATLTIQQGKLSANPLPRTQENLKNGKIFYGYYCLMCHGEKGDGNGPVGQSYVPKPTDLSSSTVTAMNDGQLYYRMLNGTGHSPVLVTTVLPEHRWPLVMYVRTFATKKP